MKQKINRKKEREKERKRRGKMSNEKCFEKTLFFPKTKKEKEILKIFRLIEKFFFTLPSSAKSIRLHQIFFDCWLFGFTEVLNFPQQPENFYPTNTPLFLFPYFYLYFLNCTQKKKILINFSVLYMASANF